MKIACMQPYLFPYKGYFDLIRSVDKFVVEDDLKFMKGGWINRNNFPEPFTFRLKKHSDYAKIKDCYFYDIEADKKEFLKKTGLNAKVYLNVLNQYDDVATNIFYSLIQITNELGINTPFYRSSEFKHGKFVEGILDMVKVLGGDTYVNLPGGRKLYNQEMFGDIKLEFIDTVPGPSILCELA